MCGISGIIDKSNNHINKSEIRNINDLISHRGPDDEGFFFGENFAFGHRRLSILDLSYDGHQPMHYLDGRYTITYNGEVYNYLELREELQQDGYCFKSDTDTEVILASYDRWGKSCVERFNGMWAFSIYDKQADIIFCSRDRFGIKPFYYTEVGGKFIFGSEIKQLLEFYKDRYINNDILLDYLILGLEEHTNETFFDKIYKLPQSHNLIYDLSENTFKVEKYYEISISPELKKISEKSSIRLYKEKFVDSVRIRLRSDVKVGTCLSGGMDSSSIAAVASDIYNKQSNTQFIAIHGKSIEDKTDESIFAKEVAEYCNLNLNIIEPSFEDFVNNIDEVIYTQEEPFGGVSIFMQYFVMKKSKELNCKVMLDGQGADETLFGYENYFQIILAFYLKKFSILSFFRIILDINKYQISTLKTVLRSILTLFPQIRIGRIIRKSFIKSKYIDKKRIKNYYSIDNIDSFQRKQITKLNLPHLLRCEDKNSMRNSIETRLPFIDYRLVDLTMNFNIRHKFKSGFLKNILRKSLQDLLPESVLWRRNKFGFEAPVDIWTKKHEAIMLSSIRKSRILQEVVDFNKLKLNNIIIWRLYNISRWEEIYNIKV